MDVVNQGLVRFSERFKAMSPTARLLAALAALLVVASLVWLSRQQTASGKSYLMAGQTFSATQLQHMESALGQAGLTEYEIDGARIRVPAQQQAKYMAALAEAGALPADFGEYLQKAVNTSGFMLYGARQEAQLKVAIQSELQGVINNFHGIERSFVQIAEETSQGFPRTKTVTASVSVQPSVGQKLDERSVAAIRWIVASAWGGLKPESVTVADMSSGRLFVGPLDSGSAAAGAYAENKQQLELHWQEKIARSLGISGVIVTANVELAADGRTPRHVAVSVGVPQSHFASVWQQQQALVPGVAAGPPDPAAFAAFEAHETERIRQAVAPLLLPAEPGMDNSSLVAVTTIYPPAPAPAAPEGYEEIALAWLAANWQAVGIGGLVLLGLLLVRSAARAEATQSAEKETSDSMGEDLQTLLAAAEEREPAITARAPIPPPHMPTDTRRAELAEVVRQDPEAAASVLRNWIRNAS